MSKEWQTITLAELCDIKTGKRDANHGNPNGKYHFFTCAKDHSYIDDYSFDTEAILVAGNGDVGAAKYFKGKFDAYQRTYVLHNFSPKVDVFYLFRYIDGFLKDTVSKQKLGGTMPYIKLGMLQDFEIPLPPLPEQKRIVKLLDEAFEKLDIAREKVEANIRNAEELFESYLEGVFSNPGEDWEEHPLNNICIVERGSSPRPIKNFITDSSDGVNWIKIGDTKNVDRYLYTTRQKITQEGAEKSRHVKEGDLILSNSMSFGRPYIMKTNGYIHDGWFVLRPSENIDSEFFYDLLSSPQVQEQISALANGSVVKNISGDLIKKVILPIPLISEQKSIVAKLNTLSTKTKKLEAIYQQKLNNLEKLEKSVLQKTFKIDS